MPASRRRRGLRRVYLLAPARGSQNVDQVRPDRLLLGLDQRAVVAERRVGVADRRLAVDHVGAEQTSRRAPITATGCDAAWR
jgi:hypothetical protein